MHLSRRRFALIAGAGGVTQFATPRTTPEDHVVIGGEQQEADGGCDNVEYVMDAASLGMAKGVIMLGHAMSKGPGMKIMPTG